MKAIFTSTRHSITFRMTATVCLFLILFQAVLAAFIYFYFKQEFKKTISAQQLTLLTVLTQSIDHKILSSQKLIVEVSKLVTPEITNDINAAQHYLDNRPGTRALFDDGLFLLSPDGKLIAESPYLPNRRGRDLSSRDYYKKTIFSGLPVISEPYISTHTPGTPVVMFTAPVRDNSGKLIAILGGSLNLLQDNFLGELSRTRIAKTGYLYVITSDRVLIMHPDKSLIMKQSQNAGTNHLLDEAYKGFEGSGENVNSWGLKSLSSFKHFKTTDWIISANYPLGEAYLPIYAFRRYLTVAVLIATLFSVLIVRLMMGRFTGTLVRFANHVKSFSSLQGKERLFINDSGDEIGVLARTFNAMVQQEDRKNAELVRASTHDDLTGLFNRAYFDTELARLSRGRLMPISVVVADLDGLKICNDANGHAVGDAMIKAAARVLIESFRAEDIVARIGGDEFAVLLPGVDAEQAQLALERVRIAEGNVEPVFGGCALAMSLGQTTCKTPEGLGEALRLADRQMYIQKASRKKEKAGRA